MPVPFPYFPQRRLAYHADGTRVFRKSGAEWIEFPHRAVMYLNGSKAHVALASTESLIMPDPDGIDLTEIAVMFPEPTTVTGILFLVDSHESGNPDQHRYRVYGSKNTTSIGDGDWMDLGRPRWGNPPGNAGSDYGFHLGTNVELPPPTDYGQVDGWKTPLWDVDGIPFVGGPFSDWPLGTGESGSIIPLYGSEFESIVGLRIVMEGSISKTWGLNLNLYGYSDLVTGLEVIRDDGGHLTPDDLDFGDVTRATAELTSTYPLSPPFPATGEGHVIGPYRIRNNSPDKTATDVVLRLTHPIDRAIFDAYGDPETGRSIITHFAALKYDTRAWQWEYQPNTLGYSSFHDEVIGALAPGEVSEKFWIGFFLLPLWGDPSFGYTELEFWMTFPTLFVQTIPGGWE